MDDIAVESVDGELFTVQQARAQARRYYLAGFALLPLFWGANAWLHWPSLKGGRGSGPPVDAVVRDCERARALLFLWSLRVWATLSLLPLPPCRGHKLLLAAIARSPCCAPDDPIFPIFFNLLKQTRAARRSASVRRRRRCWRGRSCSPSAAAASWATACLTRSTRRASTCGAS